MKQIVEDLLREARIQYCWLRFEIAFFPWTKTEWLHKCLGESQKRSARQIWKMEKHRGLL